MKKKDWILLGFCIVSVVCVVSCAASRPDATLRPVDPTPARGQGVDDDADGVENFKDKCPRTPTDQTVGENGCSNAVLKIAPLYKNIGFGYNRAQLKAGAYVLLDQIVAGLKARPHIDIELRGHTDNRGDTRYNQQLALKRARAVKGYMVGKGIDAARIFTVALGADRPMATNQTPEGRALNRRVEALPIL